MGAAVAPFLGDSRERKERAVMEAGRARRRESVPAREVSEGFAGLAPDPRALQAALEGAAGLSFSDGNAVEILEDEQSLVRLGEDIGRATRSVTFQVYYTEEGHVLRRFAKLFRERAEAGVRVLLLLDAFGTKRLSRREIQRMVGDAVEVGRLRAQRLRHPFRFLHRAHTRSCVIDGRVAYTGGFGLADKWDPAPGEGPAWRELGVRVTGPAALRLQARFTEFWAEVRGEILQGPEFFPAGTVEGGGRTTAGVLASNAAQPVSAALRFLDVLASSAERRLWIYSGYFAPGPDQRRLLESAARRGVDVRVLTCNGSTDLPLVRLSGRGNFPLLLEAGVRIWEFQPRMLHAKALLLDDLLMGIGTLNVDPVSSQLNEETMLVAIDRDLTGELARLFAEDLDRAREVTLDALVSQSLARRALEKACATLVRVP
jgi:cardiolipin synthase A/B